jgi:hypothetical protein
MMAVSGELNLETGLKPGVDFGLLQRWFPSEPECAAAFDPLLSPIQEFLGRPAKKIRAQLVFSSFDLARGTAEPAPDQQSLLQALAGLVEALHAGSLVIDDIQDAGENRRGRPALHAMIGQPSAINAANWLYFWPADQMRRESLPPEIELEIYRLYHQTMTRAHYGQALDLAFDMTQMPRDRVHSICMAAIGLKTGALMGMCSELGAIAASADSTIRTRLSAFGESFGSCLQMFNDASEFRTDASKPRPGGPFIRPSWIWAVASQRLDESEFVEFQQLMSRVADASSFEQLSRHPVLGHAWHQASEAMNSCVGELKQDFRNHRAIEVVDQMAKRVQDAYA